MQCKFCSAEFQANVDEDICPQCQAKLKSTALDSNSFFDKTRAGVEEPSADGPETNGPRGKNIWTAKQSEAFNIGWPLSVAVHPNGDIFVLDEPDEYRILRLDANGEFKETVLDIPISSDPGGVEDPQGLAIDSSGRIYIPDAANDRISVWNQDATFKQWIGTTGNKPGQFAHPVDVEIDADGFVYVADTFNRRIQKLSLDGLVSLVVSDLGEWGSLAEPVAIALDEEGNMYVGDADRNTIYMLDPDGAPLKRLPTTDEDDEFFQKPGDIRVLPDAGFLVSDRSNLRIRRFDNTWKLSGVVDLSHDVEEVADGGDIAALGEYVLIPDRFNECIYCMEFE